MNLKLLSVAFGTAIFWISCSPSSSVKDLNIKGDMTAKKIVVADFTTTPEIDSIAVKWYQSPDVNGDWQLLQGIDTKELVLIAPNTGNFIKCEVTSFKAGEQVDIESVVSPSAVKYDGNPNTEWFKDAGMGVMLHFLQPMYIAKDDSVTTWDSIVDNFDVKTFAKGCNDAGAKYVLFALGQNSGHYCSPNAAYERILGPDSKGLCSKRDLPMDLFDELDKYGIKMMFYLPGNPPIWNKLVSEKMDYSYGKDTPTSQFAQKCWEDVITEWSQRYEDKLSGWWFDGMYYGGIIETRTDMSLKHNINTHTLAAKAGNPESIVTYNYGVDKIQSNTPYNDYSAGEEGRIIQLPESRWVEDGVQWFLFTYLGNWWGANGTQFKTEDLTNWAEKVFEKDGVICFDIYADKNGNMSADQIKQAKAVRDVFEKVKKSK